ncbi:hypothetical protein U9M48_001481 [Paspalum notatum var. saurae]|uniref:Uncharacterized protein n=1 Tax=Paspalum notatum var. saurae TaxID=547442 RepID=A0AAQ3SIC5_PASNO
MAICLIKLQRSFLLSVFCKLRLFELDQVKAQPVATSQIMRAIRPISCPSLSCPIYVCMSTSMSSKLRPLVSGSCVYTNEHAAAATPAYSRKHPGMVIQSAREMNVMVTSAHVTRFTAVPSPVPCARSRSGMISEL